MLFGNCVDLVPALSGDDRKLRQTCEAGFDYLEAALAPIAQLPETEFAALCEKQKALPLPVLTANCMFPSSAHLVGAAADDAAIRAYLHRALLRARRLGIRTVVLGSGGARQQPEGYDREKAYADFGALLSRVFVPECESSGVRVAIEPLRNPPVNFINTLVDGMQLVRAASSPWISLLADTIHMMHSGEPATELVRLRNDLCHVHISDWNRALPEQSYSPELTALLTQLKASGYNGTVSFEASDSTAEEGLARALRLLRKTLQ